MIAVTRALSLARDERLARAARRGAESSLRETPLRTGDACASRLPARGLAALIRSVRREHRLASGAMQPERMRAGTALGDVRNRRPAHPLAPSNIQEPERDTPV